MSARQMIQTVDSYCMLDASIVAVYLFGSFAHGREQPMSDVDLAILLDERAESMDRKQLLARLHRDLGRLLRKDIHILVLNDASYVVRVEALFRGRCVHVKDEESLARFRMLTLSLFADFAPYLDHLHQRLKRRLGAHSHGQ